MRQIQKWFAFILSVIFLSFYISPVLAVYPEPLKAKKGMVVTEQRLASEIGVKILQQGGNAVDAAVAVGYALAVVNPCCGNIGGGGFMLIRLANGKAIFLNFREKAPLAAKATMYLNAKGEILQDKSTYGYSSVAVPGTVMGLDLALKKYGTMTRQQVMAPAIELAEKGYILKSGDIAILDKGTHNFSKQKNVSLIFLKNGKPYAVGDRLVQKDLARTLRYLSKTGADGFYKGKIAKTVVEESQKNGGILTLQDFAKYQAEELKPLTCSYRGYDIISSPPPSSGGVTLCEMLNILEGYPLRKMGFHSAQGSHYIIEAMRFAYADRNNKLGDPDFVKNPVATLTSKAYAAKIRKQIQADHATPSTLLSTGREQPEEGEHTTHYSIMDQYGNSVAVTYTINRFFGSYMIAGNTGFFLNDEMDDFTSKPGVANQFNLVQGKANIIQPGKRPLSSMTPTIVLRNEEPLLVLGSPGGPRIISTVLLTILNILDYDLDVQAAVDAPRFHQQWLPEWVDIEKQYHVFSLDTTEKLEKMGYQLRNHALWGGVEAIYHDPNTKFLYGGSDSRKPSGGAAGY